MGNLTYSGARYWDATEAANIPAATLAVVQSLNDKVIGKFASTTARDSALATLSSDQRKGAFYWTDGVGWAGHDGTAAREVMVRGVNYNRGDLSTTVEGNGFARIPSAQCFFNGSPPSVLILTASYPRDIVTWDRSDGAGCLCVLYNTDTKQNAQPGWGVRFSWMAFK